MIGISIIKFNSISFDKKNNAIRIWMAFDGSDMELDFYSNCLWVL